MKATARTVKFGADVTVNVVLSNGATGKVSITVNGTEYNGIIENNAATVTIPNLPIGQYALDVSYGGDDFYKPCSSKVTFNVNKKTASMSASARTVHVGDDVTVNVNLPEDATGEVLMSIDGVDYIASVENGTASIVISDLPAGQYAFNVTYSGDGIYKARTNVVTFNVNKYNVRMKTTVNYNEDESCALLNIVFSPDATGEVHVDFNETEYYALIENGSAVVSIQNLPPSENTFNVRYSGDCKYKEYSAIVKLKV